MSDLTGRCHCGAVTYVVHGSVKSVVNCHCGMCRSMNGAAFSTYVIVIRNELAIRQGHDFLRQYPVTDTGLKYYCVECGSPLFNTNIEKYGDYAMLYLGTFVNPGDLPEPVNIFHEDRLEWIGSIAELASFARLPKR